MQDTLRGVLDVALAEAANWEVDLPRETWTERHCAQLALLASSILWTEEAEAALDELEGTEDAGLS